MSARRAASGNVTSQLSALYARKDANNGAVARACTGEAELGAAGCTKFGERAAGDGARGFSGTLISARQRGKLGRVSTPRHFVARVGARARARRSRARNFVAFIRVPANDTALRGSRAESLPRGFFAGLVSGPRSSHRIKLISGRSEPSRAGNARFSSGSRLYPSLRVLKARPLISRPLRRDT